FRSVVNVQVARRVTDLGNVQSIVALVQLARAQDVLEAPELVLGTRPQGLTVAPQSHAAVEGPFDHSQPAVWVPAQDEEFTCLVRSEGKADLLFGQPCRQVTG